MEEHSLWAVVRISVICYWEEWESLKGDLLHCQSERKPQGWSGKGARVQLTALLGVPPSLGLPYPPGAFPPPYCDLGQETLEVLDFMGSVPRGLPLGLKVCPNKLLQGD